MLDGIMIFVRRFAELFITNIIISALITLFYTNGTITGRAEITLWLFIGAVIFFSANVIMQRICYYCMGQFHFEYYVINAAAYLLFAAVGYFVYFMYSAEVYTWMFAITKWVRYTINGVEIYLSAFIFHIVGFVSVFLSPAGIVTENFDDRQ